VSAALARTAATVEAHLSGVKVYNVGDEPQKQAYIVGKAPDGRWAGLETTAVETHGPSAGPAATPPSPRLPR
jgi:hypothetical protein